jgi:hypothetical protein
MNRCAMLGSRVIRYLGWTEEEVPRRWERMIFSPITTPIQTGTKIIYKGSAPVGVFGLKCVRYMDVNPATCF